MSCGASASVLLLRQVVFTSQLQSILLGLPAGYPGRYKNKTLRRPLIYIHGHGLIVGQRCKPRRRPADDASVEERELGFVDRIVEAPHRRVDREADIV